MVSMSRAEAEKEGAFVFDGFLSFYCKTRADSKGVVSEQSVAPQLPSKTGLALVPCSRSAALSFVVRQFFAFGSPWIFGRYVKTGEGRPSCPGHGG